MTLKIERSKDMSNHKQKVGNQTPTQSAIMAVDEDGLWVHQKFGYAIPKRNGKTEVIYIKKI